MKKIDEMEEMVEVNLTEAEKKQNLTVDALIEITVL